MREEPSLQERIIYYYQHSRHVCKEREFSIDNLLVRIHFIMVMIMWTGLAPWEFDFLPPDSLTSTFLGHVCTYQPRQTPCVQPEAVSE